MANIPKNLLRALTIASLGLALSLSALERYQAEPQNEGAARSKELVRSLQLLGEHQRRAHEGAIRQALVQLGLFEDQSKTFRQERYLGEFDRFVTDSFGFIGANGTSVVPNSPALKTQLDRLLEFARTYAAGAVELENRVDPNTLDEVLKQNADIEAALLRATFLVSGTLSNQGLKVQQRSWSAMITYALVAALLLLLIFQAPNDKRDKPTELPRENNEPAAEASAAENPSQPPPGALRRAESELAWQRLYLENLQNSLSSVLVTVDRDFSIASANLEARRQFTDLKEAKGLAAWSLFAALEAVIPDFLSQITGLLADGPGIDVQAIPWSKDAQERLFDIAVRPYRDESGRARGLLFLVEDVTEATQTRTRLLEAERLAAVGRLSTQVAHEVRNPLSAIGLNAELLLEEFEMHLAADYRHEATDIIKAMLQEIERLSAVTESYLGMARLPEAVLTTVDTTALLRDIVQLHKKEMDVRGVELIGPKPQPKIIANADGDQLRQAVVNVMRNAFEAIKEQGQICLETSYVENSVHLTITDNGPGIPKAVLERVFDAFYTTKSEGTGLGLFLVHNIISEQFGSVEIESPHPKKTGGTKITLILPRDPKISTEELSV